ncbi:hypothetical protein CLV56_0044 [Mumia flava]|uniref:Lipoprotein n=1 Tax=Mumia flava TaxID=1348852 RepID=A0A0B2BBL7_9ACTN|nr:hypothetical protein [Mumia flava]PJJ55845.1 hypothetical protein CLV56_0044 [Mumia flava]
MIRPLRALPAVLLAGVALTACGGGGDESAAYCDQVEAFADAAQDLDAEQASTYAEEVQKVVDEAPDGIVDAWTTLQEGFAAVADGDVEGVDADAIQEATDSIEQNVKDDCDLDLNELG